MLDKQGRAAVMDFGIARSIESGGMTQTGMLVGTPEYMSPEQVMGEHVDVRSDLFTLGVILYELLTGADAVQIGHSPIGDVQADARATQAAH